MKGDGASPSVPSKQVVAGSSPAGPTNCKPKRLLTLDAAIIGGGPAGTAAAISLRQLAPAATIAIFDAASSDGWRPGEMLAPGAESILDSLGLGGAFHAQGFVESFGTRAAWGSPEPGENDFLFGLRG